MFGRPHNPEWVAGQIQRFQHIDDRPYYSAQYDPAYESVQGDRGSIIGYPIKTALGFGALTYAYRMGSALNLTPFSSSFGAHALESRYRLRTLPWILDKPLDMVSPLREPLIPGASAEGRKNFMNKLSLGFMDKRLLSPDELTRVIGDMKLPVYSLQRPPRGFERMSGVSVHQYSPSGVSAQDMFRRMYDINVTDDVTSIKRALPRDGVSAARFMEIQRQHTISVGDILRGNIERLRDPATGEPAGRYTHPGVRGYYHRVRDLTVGERGIFSWGEEGRRLRWQNIFGSRRGARRTYDQVTQAMTRTLTDAGYTPTQVTQALQTGNFERYAFGVAHKASRIALARRVMGASLGIGLAAIGIQKAVTGITQAAERTLSTLRPITHMNFGGDIVMNDRMATERQRALQEIQNAQMNARYLMGNEAALNHG